MSNIGRRLVLLICLLCAVSAFSESPIDTLSSTVVLLHILKSEPVTKGGNPVIEGGKPLMKLVPEGATGFLVTPDDKALILVTAEHVATVIKSDFRVTIRDENDTSFDVSSEDCTGTKNVHWITHGKEDIAVTILHPSKDVIAKLKGHFYPKKFISSDTKAPDRDRPLTTLGFPLLIGASEHFSPISRESKPVSGLVTFDRFDTKTPATFFLLDNPSIAGFSGAPVLLIPTAYSVGNTLMFPEAGAAVTCVGVVHGTVADDTGGKMAAVTPSVYINETIDKAMKP